MREKIYPKQERASRSDKLPDTGLPMASTVSADAVAGASEPSVEREETRPMEMSHLHTPAAPETPLSPAMESYEDAVQQQTPTPAAEIAPSTTPLDTTSQRPTDPKSTPTSPHDALTRKDTERLGPATEAPITHTQTNSGPILSISLMLTTGARHPYKIDEKYLRNRKVEAKGSDGEFDPREISGYQLKELIWTDWRNEWDPRPVSPSSIRLILMGRMIDDKMMLKGTFSRCSSSSSSKRAGHHLLQSRYTDILIYRIPIQPRQHQRRPHDGQAGRFDRRRRSSRRQRVGQRRSIASEGWGGERGGV